MPLIPLALKVLIVFVAAFALGWMLWPALRARLDDADPPRALRGLPLRLLTATLALLRPASIPVARMSNAERIDAIDRLLPQTQCAQCGYPGCRPYATAIANGEADINQCPPGGEAGVRKLADLLGRAAKPLNPGNGIEKPAFVALIVEEDCIGCTKCIQACPVDAIVGAPKRMHTVIADLCTGCELCLPPCPVDCIVLIAPPEQPTLKWCSMDAAS